MALFRVEMAKQWRRQRTYVVLAITVVIPGRDRGRGCAESERSDPGESAGTREQLRRVCDPNWSLSAGRHALTS